VLFGASVVGRVEGAAHFIYIIGLGCVGNHIKHYCKCNNYL